MTQDEKKRTIIWALMAVRRYCKKQKCGACKFSGFCGRRNPGGLTKKEIETVATEVAENEEKKTEGKSND